VTNTWVGRTARADPQLVGTDNLRVVLMGKLPSPGTIADCFTTAKRACHASISAKRKGSIPNREQQDDSIVDTGFDTCPQAIGTFWMLNASTPER
jgi:hypothetical protein